MKKFFKNKYLSLFILLFCVLSILVVFQNCTHELTITIPTSCYSDDSNKSVTVQFPFSTSSQVASANCRQNAPVATSSFVNCTMLNLDNQIGKVMPQGNQLVFSNLESHYYNFSIEIATENGVIESGEFFFTSCDDGNDNDTPKNDPCAGVTCSPNGNATCGESCVNGSCTGGTDCTSTGRTCSGGACVDVDLCAGVNCSPNDNATCGESCVNGSCTGGTDCTSTGRTCSGGACVCPSGKSWNGASCVDDDPCDGVTCGDCEKCDAGNCVADSNQEGDSCTGQTCGTCQSGVCTANDTCGEKLSDMDLRQSQCRVCNNGNSCTPPANKPDGTACASQTCGSCLDGVCTANDECDAGNDRCKVCPSTCGTARTVNCGEGGEELFEGYPRDSLPQDWFK